jgi:hypothetical protein
MLNKESLNSKRRDKSIMSMIWVTTMVESQDQEEDQLEETQWDQLVISIHHRFTISSIMTILILPESHQKMLLNSSISWVPIELILREQDQRIQCTMIKTIATERIEPTGFICFSVWASSAMHLPDLVLNKTELEEPQDSKATRACQVIISTTEVVSSS